MKDCFVKIRNSLAEKNRKTAGLLRFFGIAAIVFSFLYRAKPANLPGCGIVSPPY